ncbi:MAG: NEW3 domain-containing protein [Chloroflexota bacterium]
MRLMRAFVAAALVVLAVAPAAVFAQGPLEMTTDFPSVVADPGATVRFPITVTTDTAQRVDLTVIGQPDGWETSLRGAGSTIAAVFTSSNPEVPGEISAEFTAEVTVPDDVGAGSNQVVIEGRSSAGIATRLTLDIVTEEQQPGAVTLEADFPNLQGATSATFRFNLTLTNQTNTQLTFGLEGDGPLGWTVDARPSGETQASTAVVDAGSDAQIAVTVEPPANAPAGDNVITVRAVSGSFVAEAPLSVEITGSFAMTLDTSDGRLNARVAAGAPTVLNLVIDNNGTAPISGLTLGSTPPSDWTVTFSPDAFDEIAPGATETATATITSSSDSLAGDYVITIRASSDDASDSIEIRTTVETSPLGYLIGIAVLVAVAVGLFVVFQRYGRR